MCKEYDITIFTIYSKGELEKQLSSKIKLKSLYNQKYTDFNTWKRKVIPLKILFFKNKIYKKYISENCDVEIAFLEGPITRLFSVKNKKTRKIAWIHNDITKVFGRGLKAKIKKILDKKIYSKYETLVFVSKDNLKKFNELYSEIKNEYLEPVKKEIIYNYIDKERVKNKSNENIKEVFNKEVLNFVTVARLVPQKAIDRLIKVHKKLIDNGFNHNFYVIGNGPEKENLEKLVNSEQIAQTFHLLGKKENPYPYIKNADFFCLLSEFEGYGMVLEEAKILEKPIIITDTAAREAVEKYDEAQILENTQEGIYNGLKDIILKGKIQKSEQKMEYDNGNIIKKIKEILV